jgi:hypothetical protein
MASCLSTCCFQHISESQEVFHDAVIKKRETLDPVCRTVSALCLMIISMSISCYALGLISSTAMSCMVVPSGILCIFALHTIHTINRADKTNQELSKKLYSDKK